MREHITTTLLTSNQMIIGRSNRRMILRRFVAQTMLFATRLEIIVWFLPSRGSSLHSFVHLSHHVSTCMRIATPCDIVGNGLPFFKSGGASCSSISEKCALHNSRSMKWLGRLSEDMRPSCAQ